MSDKTTMLIRISYVVIFKAVYYLTVCAAAGMVAETVKRLLGGAG